MALMMGACGEQAARTADPPAAPSEVETAAPRAGGAEGRVIRGAVRSRGGKPVEGASVTATAWLFEGETGGREIALGKATSGRNGRFEIRLPEEFLAATRGPDFWGSSIDVDADHDECWCATKTGTQRADFEEVVITCDRAPPGMADTVRARLEALRTSPRKGNFKHGIDPIDGYEEEDQQLFDFLGEAMQNSRTALEAVREYEDDPDENIRAIAYELLALEWKTQGDAAAPPEGREPEIVRRRIEWFIEDIRKAPHGGHYYPGADIDDICRRCGFRYEVVYHGGLIELSREDALEILKKYEGEEGQLGIFRDLLTESVLGWKPGPKPPPVRRSNEVKLELPEWARNPEEACLLYAGSSELWLVRADGAEKVRIDPEDLSLRGARWSPDGKRIAAYGDWDFVQYDIWIFDLAEAVVRRATRDRDHDWHPRWLPDSERLLVVRGRYDRKDFFLIDVETREEERVARFGRYVDDLAVSPDGRQAAFSPGDRAKPGLFLLDFDAGSIRRLPTDPPLAVAPAWSPDGRYVSFRHWRRNAATDHLFEPATGVSRKIPHPPARSPDGSRIAFLGPSAGLLGTCRVDGSESKIVAKLDGWLPVGNPAWSGNSKRLAFAVRRPDDSAADVFTVNADGTGLKPLGVGFIDPKATPLAWRPSGR